MTAFASFQRLLQHWLPGIVRPPAPDRRIVAKVRELAASLRGLGDDALRARIDELRAIVRDGRPCTDPTVLTPALAIVNEGTRRVLGFELYDVQLLAGATLARGAIAEMATGEGKTLVALLPAFVHSLGGEGVHVATPNAYLAERDYEQITPVFRMLGTTTGLITEKGTPEQKREAYQCDITYATGYDLGFDYLRDRLQAVRTPKPSLGQRHTEKLRGRTRPTPARIQPRHACAIIDEIDSVLIDEACLPLVLSDASPAQSRLAATYIEANRVAGSLRRDEDYVIDTSGQRATLTSQGLQRIHGAYTGHLRLALDRPWAKYVEKALVARYFHERDVDYVVRDGKIMLVDGFTGRILPERSWHDGLHQAVEAKEGLLPSGEMRTGAKVSRQRFFRLYKVICGMTGTAGGQEREFWGLYQLPVIPIPLRKGCQRETYRPRFFRDSDTKWQAITEEVAAIHAKGRPVLIGTRTIATSELLASRLETLGISFELLNGMQDRKEAEIVAMAGMPGAVTIATNMAGRGTDIRLGPGVAELGGLHVVGAEINESLRIDRQLLGRAGRQGDPGSGRFFVSADDALISRFGEGLRRRMLKMSHDNGEIQRDLSREVAAVQLAAEEAARIQRRQTLSLGAWLDGVSAALGDKG